MLILKHRYLSGQCNRGISTVSRWIRVKLSHIIKIYVYEYKTVSKFYKNNGIDAVGVADLVIFHHTLIILHRLVTLL